jgi:D-serine deaminase-like pyridoxal phosphate-dependent protein
VPGQIVIDAGSKTLTSDLCGPAPDSGFGHVLEYPQARISRLSEEHGQVDVRACQTIPRLGERVTVIPNHICPCVNLQSTVWWRDEENQLQELPIDARGLLT